MVKHDFGIMNFEPEKGMRFDKYEPHKYNCISVDDVVLECLAEDLSEINFYWHTVDIPSKGLAYNGITLIPPTSMQKLINVIKSVQELTELKYLLKIALVKNKWIIHFGI